MPSQVIAKAQPARGDVHVNRPLSNVSLHFAQNANHFVASRCFPNVPVTARTDNYFTFDRGMFNRDEMKVRAPGAPTAGSGFNVSTDTYSALVYGVHHDIPDQVRQNADAGVALDVQATNLVTTQAMIRKEADWTSNYFGTSVWTTDITGVNSSPSGAQVLQWDDASSTPIEDIRAGVATILESTGMMPNKLVVGFQVWNALRDHPDIVDRIKYGQTQGGPAVADRQAIAAVLGVDEVLPMMAIRNTAAEAATNAHSFIGGKAALLCYAAPAPGLMTASAGYTYSWTGYTGANEMGIRIRRYRRPEEFASDRVEAELAFDHKVVSPDLGYFWTTIVP